MLEPSKMVAVSHVIQIAVAPVFLLLAIGTMLTVMTNRLGRIIDRSRVVTGKLESASSEAGAEHHAELAVLSQRSKLIGMAITLFTTTALLVCAVIAVLFLANFFVFDIALFIALLFIAAMLLLVLALLIFLREIFIATAYLRIGSR